ncbi:MAG: MGH1-like glycoside hydrolase domain-containing protein, partial [Oscillospiraceae bacterium]
GYAADIGRLSNALQTAWDEDSGYFSYTLHNTDGTLKEFLRTEAGENANKGMDGVMALVGGSCTPKQKKALTGHIFGPQEMFTPYGITAVDQSAGYFRDNGYWNGTVWFSHQWLLWKNMLDLGLGEQAWQIARTALEAWRTETGATLNTFELLQVATGRGGWFHQFGGLSAPILLWAYSYFVPGNLSAGLGTRLWGPVFAPGNSACSLHACTEDTGGQSVLCVTLSPSSSGWRAAINGKEVPCIQRTQAAIELMLPPGQSNLAIQLAPRRRRQNPARL